MRKANLQQPAIAFIKQTSTDKNPIAQRIIDAVEKSQDVTLEDAEILLQVIKENQMPVRFNSSIAAKKQHSLMIMR